METIELETIDTSISVEPIPWTAGNTLIEQWQQQYNNKLYPIAIQREAQDPTPIWTNWSEIVTYTHKLGITPSAIQFTVGINRQATPFGSIVVWGVVHRSWGCYVVREDLNYCFWHNLYTSPNYDITRTDVCFFIEYNHLKVTWEVVWVSQNTISIKYSKEVVTSPSNYLINILAIVMW